MLTWTHRQFIRLDDGNFKETNTPISTGVARSLLVNHGFCSDVHRAGSELMIALDLNHTIELPETSTKHRAAILPPTNLERT